MRCDEFEHRLNEQLDERRAWRADAALVEHAAACGACLRLAASYDALVAGLSRLDVPAPSAAAVDHIVAAVHERADDDAPTIAVARPNELAAARDRSNTRRAAPRWAYAAFAMAACLAVAATIGIVATPRGGRAPDTAGAPSLASGSPEALRSPGAAREEQAIVAPPAESLARQAADSYLALARQTNSSLASAFRAIPTVTRLDEPSAAAPADAWVEEVAGDFEPMARSAGGAIQSLFRAFDVRVEQPPRREVQS